MQYPAAVAWIACNDDDGVSHAVNVDVVSEMVTVCLVADLAGKSPVDVAADVVKYRLKHRSAS